MAAFDSRSRRLLAAGGLLWPLLAAAGAAAQDAAYFSPTYAASRGSPYSEVYARTFGAPPLETAAPAPAGTGASGAAGAAPAPTVVYVIEGGRLLTYRAEDYAGGGAAVAGTPLPAAAPGGRLYGAVPPASAGAPVPLQPDPKAP